MYLMCHNETRGKGLKKFTARCFQDKRSPRRLKTTPKMALESFITCVHAHPL